MSPSLWFANRAIFDYAAGDRALVRPRLPRHRLGRGPAARAQHAEHVPAAAQEVPAPARSDHLHRRGRRPAHRTGVGPAVRDGRPLPAAEEEAGGELVGSQHPQPGADADGSCCSGAIAACLFAAGCAESDHSGVSPTGSAAVLDALAGSVDAWFRSSSTLPTGCTALDYTDHEECTTAARAELTFKGVCAGVEASGSGKGTVSGSTLNWTAEGTATQERAHVPIQSDAGHGGTRRQPASG